MPLIHRDPIIRLSGLALLLLAWTCLYRVFVEAASRGAPDWLSAVQASVGVLGNGLGLALFILGRHIHDRVPVSRRWTRSDRM